MELFVPDIGTIANFQINSNFPLQFAIEACFGRAKNITRIVASNLFRGKDGQINVIAISDDRLSKIEIEKCERFKRAHKCV